MNLALQSSRPAAAPLAQLRASDLPPGNCCTRLLTAKVVASVVQRSIDEVTAAMWPHDRVVAEVLQRAAVDPAMTTVVGWAAELAQRQVEDTLDALGPVSAAAQLMRAGVLLTFNGAAFISIPGFVAAATDAAWVAEGQPIPVQQLVGAPSTIEPRKIASISVLTREMIESSNAERLISATLIRAAGLALDAVLFDANPATAARPAGLRNGVSATTPSNNSDASEAMLEDISALISVVSAVGGVGPYAVIVNPGRAVTLAMRFISQASNIIVLGTPVVGADVVVVAAAALAAAISPNPEVETSRAATLQMSDTPVAVGSAGPVRGLFQTDSIGVKVRWPASWVLRDPRGVSWTTPAWKI